MEEYLIKLSRWFASNHPVLISHFFQTALPDSDHTINPRFHFLSLRSIEMKCFVYRARTAPINPYALPAVVANLPPRSLASVCVQMHPRWISVQSLAVECGIWYFEWRKFTKI